MLDFQKDGDFLPLSSLEGEVLETELLVIIIIIIIIIFYFVL